VSNHDPNGRVTWRDLDALEDRLERRRVGVANGLRADLREFRGAVLTMIGVATGLVVLALTAIGALIALRGP